MTFFIKNLGIILCCIYYYIKLLHINISKKTYILLSIFTILLASFSIYLDLHYPFLTMPFLICFIAIFFLFQTKITLPVTITAVSISFVFSYSIFFLSAIITICINFLLYGEKSRVFTQLLCCILQLVLMPIPFFFKRLKKGMPFLYKRFYAIPGMIISLLVIFLAVSINYSDYNIFYIILIIFLLPSSILIYLYWKNNLTKTYIDRLNERNLADLNDVLSEKQKCIQQLELENQRLAKIIHKDNKLIPAMELAVQTYINELQDQNVVSSTGKQLLEELSKLSEERKGILFRQDIRCQKPESTRILSIDNLLIYMQQKALDSDITFRFALSCDIRYLVEHMIEEGELNTLLADLLENAIIATRYNKGHHILLSIGIVSDVYSINIFDSGIPFTKEVLVKWGLEQITTHQDDAGSGIGMMTTYEIVKKKNASFMIHELSPHGGLYTKEVSILFNHLGQYILHTSRTIEELAYLNQRTDLLIVPQAEIPPSSAKSQT